MGGSEYFSNVQLGLWYGVSKATGTRPARTFYYGWCDAGTPAYHAVNCISLTVARVGACLGVGLMVASVVVVALLGTYVIKLRYEPTMARVSAVFAGTATACLLLCVALWARLLLGLSQKDAPSKAALSIGLSWLLACGGALLAFLSTLNLVLAARRIDMELVELGQRPHADGAVRRGSKSSLQQGGGAAAGSHHSHDHHHHHHRNSGKHVHHHNSGKGTGGSSSSGSSPVPMA